MNRFTANIILGFKSPRNIARMFDILNTRFNSPIVSRYLDKHIQHDIVRFCDKISDEMRLSDPLPNMTVSDYVTSFGVEFVNEEAKWINDTVFKEQQPGFVVNDGIPTAASNYRKTANTLLEEWKDAPRQGFTVREDPSGDVYTPPVGPTMPAFGCNGVSPSYPQFDVPVMSFTPSAPQIPITRQYQGRQHAPSALDHAMAIPCKIQTAEQFTGYFESPRDANSVPQGSQRPQHTPHGYFGADNHTYGSQTTGIDFTDNTSEGYNQHTGMLLDTPYRVAMNPGGYSAPVLGDGSAAMDQSLLSRRIFRDEGGVEGGIPFYRKCVARRNVDRDASEGLRGGSEFSQRESHVRGYDMSTLHRRVDQKMSNRKRIESCSESTDAASRQRPYTHW